MSHAEILAELPMLKAEERQELFERLGELLDQDLLNGYGPTESEKRILDEASAEFEADGDHGIPCRDAIRQIRAEGSQ